MGRVGVIGGSGLYKMEQFEVLDTIEVSTPFGMPSDALVLGRIGEREVVFLPRHGVGHRLLPSEINYRANIYALKSLGVEWVISVSAVGSMKEKIRPGDFVIPDQFIDLTKGRKSTFFGDGLVAHVSFADPVCPVLSSLLYEAASRLGYRVHRGGTYLCIEGPQFSTRAESLLYRSWRVDVIGMTNATEAKLAKEAELCYATVAMATDYDCWHEAEEDVSADAVIKVLMDNVERAKRLILEVVPEIPEERDCACKDALANAIITDRVRIPPETKRRLELIAGRYLK